MEEKIIFLTKDQLKKMIDDSPTELFPVSMVKEDGSDSGKFSKVCKNKCCIYIEESKAITCEFGNIFNNISLYSIKQTNINRIVRNGTEVKVILMPNKY